MCFIADNQIPVSHTQLFLQGIVARQLVQPRNAEVHLGKDVSADGGFNAVVGQYLKPQVKFAEKLVLPLLGQIAWCYD